MKEIAEKIRRYCAYQDRAESEVRLKLRQYEVTGGEAERMVAELKEEGFLDEERYVDSFVRGKINVKKWGIEKIKSHLLAKGVAAKNIEKYLTEVNRELYAQNLQTVMEKWLRTHPDQSATSPTLYRHLLSKGYSYQEIKTAIESLNK